MRRGLGDLPIKRKLTLVILLTSSVALLLMGTSLILYERFTFRGNIETNMSVLAKIIGANSTAAIAFDDAKSAREMLGALSAEPQVRAAAIYDRNGNIFATYPESIPVSQFPAHPASDGAKFAHRELSMFQPITQDQTRLGTIFLEADLGEMYLRFRVYGLLLLVVGFWSSLGSLAVSANLKRRISEPILELAKVATAVSEQQDYSVRAPRLSSDEIGQLTDAFNQMLAQLGQANAALAASEDELRTANKEKDNFLAVLSHELRTPLAPVLATLTMLEQDESLPAHAREDLDLIRRNIEVEARLIDDLLDVNRIIRGKLELARQTVDVRELVEYALKNYCAAPATKKNITVSVESTATETHAFVDSSRITQVFWNLLQNSCKFTPPGGAIRVRIFNDEHSARPKNGAPVQPGTHPPDVVVQVTDTGMGIGAETLPRVFTAFAQGTRSRSRAFGGLGLGLSISRAITELHGGSIAAESAGRDQGATFTVRLPTVAAVAREAATISPASLGMTPKRPLRVLVVEDHPDTAEQFTRLLGRAGHEARCATTVREALEYLNSATEPPFDILISDVDLPDGNGRDLMRQFRERSEVRGIAVSGYGMKEDVEQSLAAGFSEHLTKPVDWEQLQAVMEKLVSQARPRAEGLVTK